MYRARPSRYCRASTLGLSRTRCARQVAPPSRPCTAWRPAASGLHSSLPSRRRQSELENLAAKSDVIQTVTSSRRRRSEHENLFAKSDKIGKKLVKGWTGLKNKKLQATRHLILISTRARGRPSTHRNQMKLDCEHCRPPIWPPCS